MKEMTLEERKAYIQAVAYEVARGKLTLGGKGQARLKGLSINTLFTR